MSSTTDHIRAREELLGEQEVDDVGRDVPLQELAVQLELLEVVVAAGVEGGLVAGGGHGLPGQHGEQVLREPEVRLGRPELDLVGR